jgi:hypothetical protein
MLRLEDLLSDLLDALPADAGGADVGVRVLVTEVDVELPLEARIGAGGHLRASLPRGRWRSGFELPLGRLGARFTRGAP